MLTFCSLFIAQAGPTAFWSLKYSTVLILVTTSQWVQILFNHVSLSLTWFIKWIDELNLIFLTSWFNFKITLLIHHYKAHDILIHLYLVSGLSLHILQCPNTGYNKSKIYVTQCLHCWQMEINTLFASSKLDMKLKQIFLCCC